MSHANEWSRQSVNLAQFVMANMVNRTDAYGVYRGGKSFTNKTELNESVIADHFKDKGTIGLHAMSEAGTCKWCCWDFDCHHGDMETSLKNVFEAGQLVNRLTTTPFDIYPLVENSDGKGGVHVWLRFNDALAVQCLHLWAKDIAGDLACEVNPKQSKVGKPGKPGFFGNFVRLPGKHHKRDHWSGVTMGNDFAAAAMFDETLSGSWAFGAEAADMILDWSASDDAIVPTSTASDAMQETVVAQGGSGLKMPSAITVPHASALLAQVDPGRADNYDDWLRVGMACHATDSGSRMFALWEQWSKSSAKYRAGECERKWRSFGNGHATPVSLGSVVHMSDKIPRSKSVLDRITDAVINDRKFAKTWQKQRTDLETESAYHQELASAALGHGWDDATIIAVLAAWHQKHGGVEPDANKIVSAFRALQDGSESDESSDLEALGTLIGQPVRSIEQMGGPGWAQYHVVLIGDPEDRRIVVGGDEAMLSRAKFRTAFHGHGIVVQVTKKQWDQMLILMQRVMKRLEEPDADPKNFLAAMMREYMRQKTYQDENWHQAFRYNAPIIKDGLLYIHGAGLHQWLAKQGSHMKQSELYGLLRRLGFKHRTLAHKGTSRYYRTIPISQARDIGAIPED